VTPIFTVYIPQYEKLSRRNSVIVDKKKLLKKSVHILSSNYESGVSYNFGVTFHRLNSDVESGGPSDFFQGPSFS